MPQLCLNMIVKDEAAIIGQTIRRLCQQFPIDYWVISDTGSTDDTMQIIIDTFTELQISGELYQDTWENFGHNRELALTHAAGKADYLLFFDADDWIEGEVYFPKQLSADVYYFPFTSENHTTRYQRPLLVKNGSAHWRGVLHEFLEIADGASVADIPGAFHVISGRKGNRSQDPDKYLKDALLLENAIAEGRDPDLYARYLFYCAQSYQDADRPEDAKKWYLRRAEETSGWSEERYMSYLQLGFLAEKDGHDADALYYWALAAAINPNRAEAWYHQARLHHWRDRNELAYLFMEKGLGLALSGNELFATVTIYDYWLHYEQFLLAYELGYLEEAYQALKALIYSSAPERLYLDQEGMVKDLATYAREDTYHEIMLLKQIITEKGIEKLADWLTL